MFRVNLFSFSLLKRNKENSLYESHTDLPRWPYPNNLGSRFGNFFGSPSPERVQPSSSSTCSAGCSSSPLSLYPRGPHSHISPLLRPARPPPKPLLPQEAMASPTQGQVITCKGNLLDLVCSCFFASVGVAVSLYCSYDVRFDLA
jgi:hypothetical protein